MDAGRRGYAGADRSGQLGAVKRAQLAENLLRSAL